MTMNLVAQLVARDYTPQVRELEALLWRSIAAATTDTLDAVAETGPVASVATPSWSPRRPDGSTPPHLLSAEAIREALERHGGHQEPVWRELGLASRHVLARLIEKHGIEVERR